MRTASVGSPESPRSLEPSHLITVCKTSVVLLMEKESDRRRTFMAGFAQRLLTSVGKLPDDQSPLGFRHADAEGITVRGGSCTLRETTLSVSLCTQVELERQRLVDGEQDFLLFRRKGNGYRCRSRYNEHLEQLSCLSGLPLPSLPATGGSSSLPSEMLSLGEGYLSGCGASEGAFRQPNFSKSLHR